MFFKNRFEREWMRVVHRSGDFFHLVIDAIRPLDDPEFPGGVRLGFADMPRHFAFSGAHPTPGLEGLRARVAQRRESRPSVPVDERGGLISDRLGRSSFRRKITPDRASPLLLALDTFRQRCQARGLVIRVDADGCHLSAEVEDGGMGEFVRFHEPTPLEASPPSMVDQPSGEPSVVYLGDEILVVKDEGFVPGPDWTDRPIFDPAQVDRQQSIYSQDLLQWVEAQQLALDATANPPFSTLVRTRPLGSGYRFASDGCEVPPETALTEATVLGHPVQLNSDVPANAPILGSWSDMVRAVEDPGLAEIVPPAQDDLARKFFRRSPRFA